MANFSTLTRLKKCFKCHKKSVVVVHFEGGNSYGYCKKHFLHEFPSYTLGEKCKTCTDNFKCNLQEVIFTKKEIKNFREELETLPRIDLI